MVWTEAPANEFQLPNLALDGLDLGRASSRRWRNAAAAPGNVLLDKNLVEDLDRGAGGAAERLDDGHGEPLLDAVLRGDINAPLRGSAWCGNAHCKAAHRHGAELSLLHGGTPDARATAVELAAAADAAVLDRAAAANTRFPRGFRHLDCEKRPLRI